METLFYILIGAVLAWVLVLVRGRTAAFSAQKPEDYEDGHPTFNLKEHLNGAMICEGVIYGPLGRVTSSFTADFDVTWDGDKGVMDEVFHYNDGTTQDRQWRITARADGTFDLAADDVPNVGSGTASGNAVEMLYAIRLPEKSGGHILNCRDWMYLTPNGHIMNRSQFRKFGFKVAELIATMRPKDVT